MKTPEDVVKRAKEIAYEAHLGATRWDKTTPYVSHPEAVAKSLEKRSLDVQAVGWLHDVCEDCPLWTLERLRSEGFSASIIEAVDAITHRDGEPYQDYIKRVRGNSIAKMVKIEDLRHNLSTVWGVADDGVTKMIPKDKVKFHTRWNLALMILDHSCYDSLYNTH